MGLPVKKLLDEYFSKEEVQGALWDIGEPTSGTKDELVQQLRNNWESHNHDIYELLDFIDEDSLQMICYHYRLDATDAKHDVLKRRIKKANLLGYGSKPIAKVDTSHDSFITKPKQSSVIDDILSFSKKPKIRVDDNYQGTDVHFHVGTITHSKWGRIGAIATIVGIVIMIILFAVG